MPKANQQNLQVNGPSQQVAPARNTKPEGKSNRKSMGTKGGWNDSDVFGPTMR